MIHLFVIADDFTGALDTGVQFASYGAATKVVVGTGLQALEADAQTQVLVVDAETRHLPAAQAGEMLGAVLRACSQEPVVVLDTGGAVENAGADKTADRIQIANTLGALLKRLLDDGLESTVLIMGGDCLLGLMRQLDVTEIMPLCEVAPGVVLSQFTYGGRQWNLVSKSGGFGAKTLFYDLQNILERWKKELPAV